LSSPGLRQRTNTTTNWLTLQETAAYARCRTVTLAREIRAGRLNASRLASRRAWRLRVADIDRWMSGDGGEKPVLRVPSHAADEGC